MVSAGFQILGISLGIIGWIGSIVTCILPMWKVSAFVNNNIITAQTTWEGIWMTCMVQSTGQMQCKVYDSMLALSTDIKVSRALIIISILLGIVALLLSIAGGKCTNCVENEVSKAKVSITAGAIFILAGILCLVPVSYTANTTIQEFYNPMFGGNKMELGASLFIGWGSAALLILGGGLLCSNCPPNNKDNSTAKYTRPQAMAASGYV
ncbi:claudin-4 [Oryzias melastigma]|uniref:claudin-4 n=1 Tax=Oryzias melastigma TaxID=30732 RepID=UPI000CF81D88|nr:claudin-4 [Oryzias melastigma]